jgi:hypothetical protein
MKRQAVSTRVRFEVMRRDGFKCVYCGATAQETRLEVDHRVPVAERGTSEPANLVTACKSCNRGKSDTQLDAPTKLPPSAAEVRASRLARARCPVHNRQGSQASHWFYPEGERAYTYAMCSRKCPERWRVFEDGTGAEPVPGECYR